MNKESVLVRSQIKRFEKTARINKKGGRILAEVRYDDECGNGHNSFSITGTTYDHLTSSEDHHYITGGCIHDEIATHFPELQHLIKWHLMDSDGPMHYLANTTYHARDRTHPGVKIGAAVKWDTMLKFESAPFTFKEQEKGFWEYLDGVGDFDRIEVVGVPGKGREGNDLQDNFSLSGFIEEDEKKKWYRAPFSSRKDAEEFLEALRTSPFGFIRQPTAWCEAEEPDLEAARSCAIWPEATAEELRDEEKLKARLPALLQEFRRDIEALGFVY